MLSVEYDWLNKNRTELFKYRGQYVAVIGTEIVSNHSDLRIVVSETKSKFPNVIPHISKVPDIHYKIPTKSSIRKEEKNRELSLT